MPKPNLYIVFNPFGNLWLNLPFLFFNAGEKLARQGITYQYSTEDIWQRYGMELSFPLSELRRPGISSGYRKRLLNHLDRIHQELKKDCAGNHLLWNMQPLSRDGVPQLKLWLESSPVFSNYNIRPIIVSQRQDIALWQWCKTAWRQQNYTAIMEIVSSCPHYLKLSSTAEALLKNFGNNCEFIDTAPYKYSASTVADTSAKIATVLGLPSDIFLNEPSRFLPDSFAGLDMHAATYNFPFTRFGIEAHNRSAFFNLLREVEVGEGFEKPKRLPAEARTATFIEEMSADNARLEKLLGHPVFSDYSVWDRDDKSVESYPGITEFQARPFVAAMPENLRFDLLRYFRDLPGPLSAEQTALAKALENFRAKNAWVPNWRFPRQEPVLSVLTMTRNHKDYIAECIERVCAQKTDFPIEHIIIDDNSDDGTQDVIDNLAIKYPHIRPIYMPTRDTGRNVSLLFSTCKSEYAALCDGDDYFTNPGKLQMQVDFLQENRDCALCFHPVHVKFENGQRDDFIFPMLEQLPRKSKQRFYLADLIQGNFIQTNSVVYRWRFREGLPEWFNPYVCPGDWYWHLLHAETGKIGFIPRVMSVYRRHSSALYSSAFIDRDKHFAEHGMHEVKTISILNQHFKGRYFRHLANLADSFFTAFYKRQIEDPDCRALDEACDKYPEFGLHFLKTLRSVQKEHPLH